MAPAFLCLLIVSVGWAPVHASAPDSATSEFIFSIQKILFDDQFIRADSLSNEFIATHPNNPVGYLFKAGALLGKMSDLEENLYPQQLRRLIDTVITLCDSEIATSHGTAAAFLYLWRGHAHVYRSLFESHFGSFTSAIKHGFKARSDYQDGLKQDSLLYDLYFGLGNFHYWKSVKAGILRTFGIVNNDVQKGMTELKLAADSGKYFSEAARNSMIWIWLDRQQYDSAITLAETMLIKHPDSRTLRWPLAAACYEGGQFENSAVYFQYLHDYFWNNRGNYFNLIESDYRLYRCFDKLGWKAKADKILRDVSLYRNDVPKAAQRRQLAKLNYLRRELGR